MYFENGVKRHEETMPVNLFLEVDGLCLHICQPLMQPNTLTFVFLHGLECGYPPYSQECPHEPEPSLRNNG